jgi:hypothetical protein
MQTAANPDTDWLFPGRHLTAQKLRDCLREAGIPPLASRSTTWQQLVRQAPPQVLAEALGISATAALRHAARAGANWTAYAAQSQTADSGSQPPGRDRSPAQPQPESRCDQAVRHACAGPTGIRLSCGVSTGRRRRGTPPGRPAARRPPPDGRAGWPGGQTPAPGW